MIKIEDVMKAIMGSGFTPRKSTHYVSELQSTVTKEFIYLENTVGLDNSRNHYIRLVLHPHCVMTAFRIMDGVSIPASGLTHNSNLAEFPKRIHTGDTEIHYGIPINIESIRTLKMFLKLFNDQAH